MNHGSLNSYTLNSSVVDVSARSALLGYANALGDVLLRGSFRDTQARVLEAAANPKVIGLIREPVNAQAVVRSTLEIRMIARSIINGLGLSGYKLYDLAHRIRIVQSLQAIATVKARVLRVNRGVRESVYANATVKLLRMVRSKNGRTAFAALKLKAKSIPRGYKSSPLPAFAQAVAAVQARVMDTNPISVQARGDGNVMPRAFVFFAGPAISASAVGYIGTHVVIQYKFDEPALPENSFIVPFEANTFYVR